jgi:hypothetical protein
MENTLVERRNQNRGVLLPRAGEVGRHDADYEI